MANATTINDLYDRENELRDIWGTTATTKHDWAFAFRLFVLTYLRLRPSDRQQGLDRLETVAQEYTMRRCMKGFDA